MQKIYYIRKGLLGTNLYYRNEETGKYKLFKMPKDSVVKVKVSQKGFIVYTGKRQLTAYDFDRAWFEGNNVLVVENLRENLTMSVNCLTGANSPLYKKHFGYSYYIDLNNNIIKINPDVSYEKTDMRVIDEENLIAYNEKTKLYLQFQSDILANITHRYAKEQPKEMWLNALHKGVFLCS